MDSGMDERCRLCLSNDIIEESIFEPRDDETSFCTKIMICTGMIISSEDEYSKYICNHCSDMLELMYDFRKRCFKTYVSLNSTLNGVTENSNILEVHNDQTAVYDKIVEKLKQSSTSDTMNDKESDLGIDRVVSEEVVFDEDDSGKETFTERQFQVGCYVPYLEDDPEKEFPLMRRFKCTTCKNVFSSMNELDEHWDICEELVENEGPIRDFMNIDTGDDNVMYEDEVDESGNDGNDDDYHTTKKKSKNKEFCCETCGQIFKQLWLLTRHKQVKHICEKPYSCLHCPRRFFDKYELKYHQRLHQDIEDFCCNVCGRRFSRRSGLRAHMRRHTGEKPYMCGTCGKAFAHLNSLNTHERVHTGERPFKCNFCVRMFAQYSTAKTHEEMHMGGLRLHQCDVCDRMYKTEEDLRAHYVTHEGSFDHHCAQCNKSFKKSIDLKKHNIRFHFEKKPFACTECSKSFVLASELEGHMTLHKGQFPFSCPFCSKRYRLKSTLRKHVEKQHRSNNLNVDSKEVESNSRLDPSNIGLNMFSGSIS